MFALPLSPHLFELIFIDVLAVGATLQSVAAMFALPIALNT